jgi:hypothetical protein
MAEACPNVRYEGSRSVVFRMLPAGRLELPHGRHVQMVAQRKIRSRSDPSGPSASAIDRFRSGTEPGL